MTKKKIFFGLVSGLLGLSAVASITQDLMAIRAGRDAAVTPGVWHSDLEKARAYAEANGLPLVAVWSNGDTCTHCVAFEECVMSPAFRNWMKDSEIVFYFGVFNDACDGQEGYHGSSFYWCCRSQSSSVSLPYVRVWWPEGDVDECHCGSWYDGEDSGKILRCTYSDNRTDPDNFIYPGDYDTYNPGGRRIISVLVGNATASATMPVGGVVTGGLLSKNSGQNIPNLTPEAEIALANEAGGGIVEIDGELSNVEVASGVTLVVKGEGLDGNALASKISPKPHEVGQAVSLFKVKVESVTGGVSLAVVLDEEAVDPDGTAAEIVDAANIAAFGTVAEGESVPVSLQSAKKGLYYGITVSSDLAGLENTVTNVSLVRAGENGATIPVVKPTGGTAFFKVIVSDRTH